MEQVLIAPEALSVDQRVTFRRDAVGRLARMEPGECLVIDLSRTQSVDSAGLGTLIVIHRQAHARHLTVRLRGANPEIRSLLRLTKLDQLFEVEA